MLDLAAATLTGGASVAPALGLRAMDASVEVLVEEGILTQEEAGKPSTSSYCSENKEIATVIP